MNDGRDGDGRDGDGGWPEADITQVAPSDEDATQLGDPRGPGAGGAAGAGGAGAARSRRAGPA
ncbi:hypothetical protein ND747_17290, partial [Frankia sp. R82]|nr:hypothetical protein [Frankia sp. R82]